jgi:hypothetical protein
MVAIRIDGLSDKLEGIGVAERESVGRREQRMRSEGSGKKVGTTKKTKATKRGWRWRMPSVERPNFIDHAEAKIQRRFTSRPRVALAHPGYRFLFPSANPDGVLLFARHNS